MDRGIKVIEYDPTDYKAWAEHGIEGLKKSIDENSFEYVSKWTKNLDVYTEEIKKCFEHKNFTHIQRAGTLKDYSNYNGSDFVAEIVLDSRTLNKKDGFALHRIVLITADDERVIFHDPVIPEDPDKPNRSEPLLHFEDGWNKGEELCVYLKS